jgi:hypothetical protein
MKKNRLDFAAECFGPKGLERLLNDQCPACGSPRT